MTGVEAMSRLIWLYKAKILKARRERKWESEAKVGYRDPDSQAKEVEHYCVHNGKGVRGF